MKNEIATSGNWFYVVEKFFPPYTNGRPDIITLANELKIHPAEVSMIINDMKFKLREVIDKVFVSSKIKSRAAKKFIVIQYYIERRTQAEIGRIIGSSQQYIHKVVNNYRQEIVRTLREMVVLRSKDRGVDSKRKSGTIFMS